MTAKTSQWYYFCVIAKKRLLASLLVLIIVIVLSSSLIIFLSFKEKSDSSLLDKKTNELIQGSTHKPMPDSIRPLFTQVSNKKLSSKQRYDALVKIKDYLSSLYNETKSPEIRNYIREDLKKFAESNFADQFIQEEFDLTCADPSCGEKIDPEMTSVLGKIKKINMPEIYRDTIMYNLNLALLIPDEEIEEKETGLSLSVIQLEGVGIPEASETAKLIREYAKDRYNITL